MALLPSPLHLAIALAVALQAAEPPPAPAAAQPAARAGADRDRGPALQERPAAAAGRDAAPRASADLAKPPKDPAQRREWLKTQLDEVFGGKEFAKAKVSAIVVDADTGKTLYARAEKTPLNAASNVKIVTSAAGLSLLGPEYRWRTTLSIVGPPSGPPLPAGGEAAGDLYVRGSGDPDAGRPRIWRRWSAIWRRWACTRCAARWSSTTACSRAATSRPPTIRRTIRRRRARPRRRRR